MAKTQASVRFSDDEVKMIQSAARSVWNECGYDILQSVADEKGKDINSVTVSRANVIEIALDADRTYSHLETETRRDVARGTMTEAARKDFLDRYQSASYKQHIKIVKPVFQYSRYGM